MQLRTGSENNDHLPRQDRDEHRESSKTGRCFVFLSIAETVEISRLLDKVKTRAVSHLYIKTIFLPRQARDKHREKSTQKKDRFVAG